VFGEMTPASWLYAFCETGFAGSLDSKTPTMGSGRIVRDGVAFAGRSNWFERQLATKETDAQPSGSRFTGYASRTSRHDSTVSATHRFL